MKDSVDMWKQWVQGCSTSILLPIRSMWSIWRPISSTSIEWNHWPGIISRSISMLPCTTISKYQGEPSIVWWISINQCRSWRSPHWGPSAGTMCFRSCWRRGMRYHWNLGNLWRGTCINGGFKLLIFWSRILFSIRNFKIFFLPLPKRNAWQSPRSWMRLLRYSRRNWWGRLLIFWAVRRLCKLDICRRFRVWLRVEMWRLFSWLRKIDWFEKLISLNIIRIHY